MPVIIFPAVKINHGGKGNQHKKKIPAVENDPSIKQRNKKSDCQESTDDIGKCNKFHEVARMQRCHSNIMVEAVYDIHRSADLICEDLQYEAFRILGRRQLDPPDGQEQNRYHGKGGDRNDQLGEGGHSGFHHISFEWKRGRVAAEHPGLLRKSFFSQSGIR